MASIDLGATFVHDAEDLETFVVVSWSEMTVATTGNASTRAYAGGRIRAVRTPGVRTTAALKVPLIERDALDVLTDWIGKLVFVRDSRGRTMWGIFKTVAVEERRQDHRPVASFQFEQITYDEAV